MEKELKEKLFDRVYRFLAIRNRSEKEVRDYLLKKLQKYQFSSPSIEFVDEIVNHLKEEGLINDWKFIGWWVEQRAYFRPKGVYALKQELIQKGIAQELIDRYFQDSPPNEYQLAKEAVRKKIKLWQNLSPEKRKEKIINFLKRRGFRFEVIKRLIFNEEKKICYNFF